MQTFHDRPVVNLSDRDAVSLMRFLGDFPNSMAALDRSAPARRRARGVAGKIYVCHGDHPNDLIYAENLQDFFRHEGIEVETIALPPEGQRPELMRCLHDAAIGVLGLNSHLD